TRERIHAGPALGCGAAGRRAPRVNTVHSLPVDFLYDEAGVPVRGSPEVSLGMFGSLVAPEVALIDVIVVLLFGVGKLSGLGMDLGSSVKEFRKAVKDEDDKKQE